MSKKLDGGPSVPGTTTPLMARISRIFFRGLFALLPLIFSLFIISWFLRFLEDSIDQTIFAAFPEIQSLPGLGVLVGFGLIFILGLSITSPAAVIYRWIETPFRRVPFLKTLYSAIQDLVHYFDKSTRHNEGSVVLVSPPQVTAHFVGLITQKNLSEIDPALPKDHVAVFIPMSYALGGYTAFVPKSWVRPLNMTVEQAMRSALTAWMKQKPKEPLGREASLPKDPS